MEITFVNHSSLIIDTGIERILCDPWFKGSAFANGWRLLLDEAIDINSLDFDRLWISHEHPDHFSIPTLKSLVNKKPVLYQKTTDQKVKNYLESQGHMVTELPHNQTKQIAGCNITSIVTENYDSCILFDDGKIKFLNVNDSQLDKDTEIVKVIHHTPIDLISIQFHYANWAGNSGDSKIPEFKRQNAVNRIKKICEICKTNDVILFASFIYYAHEENFFWNKPFSHINKTIKELTDAGINPILMIPNQTIKLSKDKEFKNASNKNDQSLKFWEKRYKLREIRELAEPIAINHIKELYDAFLNKLHSKNNLKKYENTFIKDFRLKLKLTDHDLTLNLGLFPESYEILKTTTNENFDAAISSEALSMLFKSDFALGSITISSRIQFNYKSAYKFYFFFLIPYRNNIGSYLESSFNKDLNFKAFKTNGVLKPIFHFDKNAEYEFDEFNKLLENL